MWNPGQGQPCFVHPPSYPGFQAITCWDLKVSSAQPPSTQPWGWALFIDMEVHCHSHSFHPYSLESYRELLVTPPVSRARRGSMWSALPPQPLTPTFPWKSWRKMVTIWAFPSGCQVSLLLLHFLETVITTSPGSHVTSRVVLYLRVLKDLPHSRFFCSSHESSGNRKVALF